MLVLAASFLELNAQDDASHKSDFYFYGNATMRDDSTFILTDNLLHQTGSIWYTNDINLNESFEIELDLFFGCSDGGADGITFILHPELSIGAGAEGIGVGGLTPSFGVEMDTYQNFHLNDVHFDHAALMANGISNHKYGLTEPVPLLPKKKNVENCTFYTVKFHWNSLTQIFTYEFNGVERIRRQIDLVSLVFDGNSNVFWGLGAATGINRNKQLVRIRNLKFTSNETLSIATKASLLNGETYTFQDINFDAGSADLPEAAKPLVEKLLLFHQEHPRYSFILDCYADSTNEAGNILAKDRAEAIARHMIAKGFAKDKIIFYGNRDTSSTSANSSGEARKMNQRIELRMKIIRV